MREQTRENSNREREREVGERRARVEKAFTEADASAQLENVAVGVV